MQDDNSMASSCRRSYSYKWQKPGCFVSMLSTSLNRNAPQKPPFVAELSFKGPQDIVSDLGEPIRSWAMVAEAAPREIVGFILSIHIDPAKSTFMKSELRT